MVSQIDLNKLTDKRPTTPYHESIDGKAVLKDIYDLWRSEGFIFYKKQGGGHSLTYNSAIDVAARLYWIKRIRKIGLNNGHTCIYIVR
jgi:hypothetical protein